MMRPELEIVLACGRLQMEAADRQRASDAIVRGVDWPLLVTLAERQGLLPLLFRHVANGDVAVPAEVAGDLRRRAAANGQRSLAIAAELVSLLDRCAAAGIPVLPLKGPPLAQRVYGAQGLRQIRDLDLLFGERDLPRVRDLLTSLGYVVYMEDGGPSAVTRHSKHHVTAVSTAKDITLEIHYELLSQGGRPRWTLEALTPRLRETTFMNRPLGGLTPEDEFVYLCTHGAGHAWSRLEWLVTVVEFARSGRLDPGALAASMAAFDAGRKVGAAMRLGEELLSVQGLPVVATDRWSRLANRSVIGRLRREPSRIRETRTEKLLYRFLTDTDASARAHRAWVALTVANADDADLLDPAGRFGMLARPLGLLMRYVFRVPDRGSRGPHSQPRAQ